MDLYVGEFSLLRHSFYQAWQRGELSVDDLKVYAKEYYHLEAYLPRMLSRVHSAMEDPGQRREVLLNLISEEGEAKTHRELWAQFAGALGVSKEALETHAPSAATRRTIETLSGLVSGDWREGLAALYAYESQQPEVARSKSEGLVKFYGFGAPSADGLEFFHVHQEADQWHSDAEASLLEQSVDSGMTSRVLNSARESARALWEFLDGVSAQIGLKCQAEPVCSLN